MPKGRLELTWMGKDSSLIPAENGKYDYAWVDPQDPRAQEARSLEIVEEVGEAEDSLVVVGESGDALRSLATVPEWSKKYAGQVKQVYIDPPFNTGESFTVYEDQLEHSVWLTMMRDRLRLLRPLLSPDASVWVHLDDVEVHRMRLLLDEEFGAESFISMISWEKVAGRDNRTTISETCDYIMIYALQGNGWRHTRNLIPRTQAQILQAYGNPDNDSRGLWTSGDISAKAGPGRRADQFFDITLPSGREVGPKPGRCWLYTRERYDELLADERFYFGEGGDNVPRVKRFLSEVQDGLVPKSLWTYDGVGHNDEAKKEVNRLFPGQGVFDTPKPERLLRRVLQIGSNPGEMVMDFFGGSGTTAAVAHKMGRRFITVELQESTVKKYLVPRLKKVVAGEDQGGISTNTERVAVADLPEGVTPEQAQEFSRLLGKFSRALEIDADAVKALRSAAKTKNETYTEWSGGGGFTVARLGPSMYEVDDGTGEVYLSPEATNGAWSQAVAGQLKFTRTPEHAVFAGVRGRQRLAVIDGVVEETTVQTIVQALGAGEVAVVVGKGVLPEAEELLKERCPGSRLRRAPDQMFERGVLR